MPFEFKKLGPVGLVHIIPKIFRDERGFFVENYKREDFYAAGIMDNFVQDNHSRSAKNVLRGLHFQIPPKAQSKLVRCIYGRILDVAVDIRRDSPTFGKWEAAELTAENCEMLYIPEGYAHGFLVLSEHAEIIYKCSAQYAPAHERGIIWNDSTLKIDWPVAAPLLSGKDALLPRFEDAAVFLSSKETAKASK